MQPSRARSRGAVDRARVQDLAQGRNLAEQFRTALEAVPDAMVVVDAAGRMVLVNSQTERVFGYAHDELVGAPVEQLVPASLKSAHARHRTSYFASPRTRPMGVGLELAGRRKDGSELAVEISLSPVMLGDEQFAIAAIRDVTARKRAEDALKAANDELDSFTYSVSHDLRAPIRQIDGFARLLYDKFGASLDPAAREYVDRIQAGARHMRHLVDDLLDLARLGRQALDLQPVPVGDLVRETVADLQADTVGRSIEWRIHALPTIRCDRGLAKIALTNLMSNALKYTRPRSHAVIEIGGTSDHGQSAVYVRDNGVGFDMQYADRLFGVFQRLHRAAEFEGTGVGLATVQRVVHRHGGFIHADAEVDRGATFTFSLGPELGGDVTAESGEAPIG